MLTLASARLIVDSVLSGAARTKGRPLAAAVCDGGGHPLALAREEGAPPLLAHIAQAKAATCVAYGKPTRALAEVAADYPLWFDGIARVAMSAMGAPLIASKGGVLILGALDERLGAVGVAGDAGEIDEALAVEAIAAAGFIARAD